MNRKALLTAAIAGLVLVGCSKVVTSTSHRPTNVSRTATTPRTPAVVARNRTIQCASYVNTGRRQTRSLGTYDGMSDNCTLSGRTSALATSCR